jgi:hypothetical protein
VFAPAVTGTAMLEHDGRFDWTRAELTLGHSGYLLLVRRSAVNDADLQRVRSGVIALALHQQPALSVLLYQLGRDVPWSAAVLPDVPGPEQPQLDGPDGSRLTIVLTDAATANVHPVRIVALIKPFAEALAEAQQASAIADPQVRLDYLRRFEEEHACADVAVLSCKIAMRVGASL